jgi:hypothetical protein
VQLTADQFKSRPRETPAGVNLRGALKKLRRDFVNGGAKPSTELCNARWSIK